jgi:hypothetical protein
MEAAFTVLTTFLIAALPLAVGVTKAVDMVRNLVDPSNKFPPVVWNVLAFVIGIAFCLGWNFNLFAPLVAAIPALKESGLATGNAGEVFTGIAIGAMGGFYHDKLKEWSYRAEAYKAGTGAKVNVS